MPNTSRLILPYPTLATTPVDIPADILAVLTQMEAVVTGYKEDTFANRPAAGKHGYWFYDTTNAVLYYDNGTIWIGPIGTPAAASITQAMLAAGAAAGANRSTTFPTGGLFNGYRHTAYLTFTGDSVAVSGDYEYRADLDASYPWFAVAAADAFSGTALSIAGDGINWGDGASIAVPRAGYYTAVGTGAFSGHNANVRMLVAGSQYGSPQGWGNNIHQTFVYQGLLSATNVIKMQGNSDAGATSGPSSLIVRPRRLI